MDFSLDTIALILLYVAGGAAGLYKVVQKLKGLNTPEGKAEALDEATSLPKPNARKKPLTPAEKRRINKVLSDAEKK